MNIIEPSKTEKNLAIEAILSKGLSKPKSLWAYLSEIYCTLGLGNIFFDMVPVILITAVTTFFFMILCPMAQLQYVYTTLFSLAPAFFILIVLFTETNEQINGLYELKMTCKYTVQQIAAFRVLCFSVVGSIVSTLISLYCSQVLIVCGFFRACSLSLCALFLCAFLFVFLLRHLNGRWNYLPLILLWGVIALLPTQIFGEHWEWLLTHTPMAVIGIAAVIACALFIMEVKKMMDTRKREVAYYADC